MKSSMILHPKMYILIYSPMPCMLNAIEKWEKINNAWKKTDAIHVCKNRIHCKKGEGGEKRNSNVLKIAANDSYCWNIFFCFQFSQSRNHVSSYVFQTLQFSARWESNTRRIYYNKTNRLCLWKNKKIKINKQITRNSIPIEVIACIRFCVC